MEKYGVFRPYSSTVSKRQLKPEELLLISERHNVEVRQMVIRQRDNTERIVIIAGDKGAVPGAPVLPGERVVRDWHTHPGHRNARPSEADEAVTDWTRAPFINISRNKDTGGIVIGGALPIVR